jgi:NAD(P)H-hydrate epimerase
MAYVTKTILKGIYPKRGIWAHKGQYGKLLMVCGSKRHTGSPIFCGMAAGRTGCDLVYLAAPERAADKAARYSPTLITEPLKGERLAPKHVGQILKMAEETRASALLIGPGLWRAPETFKAILELIRRIDLPMIIDADAIRAVATDKAVLKGKRAVLTPHSNEFFALSGKAPSQDMKERTRQAETVAKKLGCTILLKGAVDIVTDGKRTALNKVHSNLMTKGGMGDTLAGICGALLARGTEPFLAGCAAAFLNGSAGVLAVKKHGEGTLATDLIDEIPDAIK